MHYCNFADCRSELLCGKKQKVPKAGKEEK
jgi:hypothetical protein